MVKQEPGEVDILAVFGVLANYKFKIMAFVVLGTVLGVGSLLILPPTYRSENVFIVTSRVKENPLEQWNMLAEQFGFKVSQTEDPLLTMLDRVLASEQFYRDFVGKSVNPAHPEDSSLVRLLKLEEVPKEELAKAIAGKAARITKYTTNKDKSYSIRVKTKSASLSKFLANEIAANLNRFFLNRAKMDLGRKIAFLTGELAANRLEVDSLSNRLRGFLEANKDFSSPLLNFRYKSLNQDLLVASEKYMLTMKAHQSLKISASQPEYFFESIVPAEEASPPGWKEILKWTAMVFAACLFLACGGVIFFQWLLRVSWNHPERK